MSINDNTATKLKWQNHAAPGGNLGEYVIATHPTANSVTLTGAALEVNSMIDKVVCIALNGICEYLNVLSNTADTYLSQTAFAGGDGLQTVSVMAPVDMWFGDQLYIVASKTAGTLGITTGSSIEVSEF